MDVEVWRIKNPSSILYVLWFALNERTTFHWRKEADLYSDFVAALGCSVMLSAQAPLLVEQLHKERILMTIICV